MPGREELISILDQYRSNYDKELEYRVKFLDLLRHPRAFYRDHFPGHITASSWIIDSTRTYVLLTHHAKLDRWLQPGGHADGHEDVKAVAQREAYEETGLSSIQILSPDVFDIDIHLIPGRGDVPEHYHYDVRFLFQAHKEEALRVSDESKDLAWVHKDDLARMTGGDDSILRMGQKVAVSGKL